jgi:mannose-1-phosphate guanylyltransferase/mannose-6-phosphate isomerase
MCGGSGTRLWPASRPDLPKQFIPLIGDQSSFQDTILRVAGIPGAGKPLIIAGVRHADVILDQLKALNVGATLLLEPEARDSAPAIAAAAAWIERQDPGSLAVIVSSDHHVPDPDAFRIAAGEALEVAKAEWIVTLGVRPTEPSTAFGYIKPGARRLADGLAHAVHAFVEKPDQATAERYIAAGFLWNSGNFVAPAALLLSELDLHAPGVSAAARDAVREATMDGADVFRLGPTFRDAPKISIDYALMEKTDRAAVAPAAFAWSDLGAWDAVKSALEPGVGGNRVTGEAVLIDTVDCLVRTSPGSHVGLIGVRDIAVVVEGGSVLVASLSASQKVKQLAETLAGRKPRRPAGLRELAARHQHWLDTAALPVWWSLGADHVGGGFHETLSVDGRARAEPRRGRVQARQIFVYASAGAAGWRGPWRAAAEHGLDYFLKRYRREDGLFRPLVDAGGAPAEGAPNLYDQAFAMLALASLYRVDPHRAELARLAAETLAASRIAFAHTAGLREAAAQPYQSNPLMHLFESALAWTEANGGPLWRDLAAELALFAMGRLIDPELGAIREYYDADWTPAAGPAGTVVWPGHQFEWAWLLDRWARHSGDGAGTAAARKLFRIGAAGVDPARSLAVDDMNDRLVITDPRARLWPQTERLKAALALDELDAAADAASALWRYLEMPTPGLWRDQALPSGRFVDEPARASSFYHIIGAIQALSRHQGLST